MLVPSLRALQQQFPQAAIHWLIDHAWYPLLQGVDGIQFHPVNKPRKPTDYFKLRRQFANTRFDVLLALQASFRANLIYPQLKAARKIGFDQARAKDLHQWFVTERIDSRENHLLEGFYQFAEALGAPPLEKPVWNLTLPPQDQEWARQQRQASRLVVINPAASKQERTHYPEFYSELIQSLSNEPDTQVVLSGGPAQWEKSLADVIGKNLNRPVLNLVGQTSLTQLAALLAEADVLIAPDTGPVHIATAVGTPVIGLYAVANPAQTGPYLSQSLTVNAYPQAVERFLRKSAQEVAWGTRVHDRKAMRLIQVADVLNKLDQAFAADTSD